MHMGCFVFVPIACNLEFILLLPEALADQISQGQSRETSLEEIQLTHVFFSEKPLHMLKVFLYKLMSEIVFLGFETVFLGPMGKHSVYFII